MSALLAVQGPSSKAATLTTAAMPRTEGLDPRRRARRNRAMGRRTAAAAVALAVAFGAITLAALEGKSVAVLATTSPSGETHRTRVWFAEEDGALWIESATDSRPFYLDLQAGPALTMEIMGPPWARNTRVARGRAELVPEPGGHERIRRLLREKYGWADAWVALLQDTSGSRAVRVVLEEDAAK
jgi:hypothetical protein